MVGDSTRAFGGIKRLMAKFPAPLVLRLYNLLLALVGMMSLPLVLFGLLWRADARRGLAARLGFGWPAGTPGELLWAHGASVGEVEALAPLVRRWQVAHPQAPVVVTALTLTGVATARRLLPGIHAITAPLDFPLVTGRLVRRLRPSLFLFTENELWPNLLLALRRKGVPSVQVSGRVSAGAASGLAMFPRVSRAVLDCVSRFLLQSEADRSRLLSLGVDAERLFVTGSLKGSGEVQEPPAVLASLASRELVVAGSTHAGEELLLAEALQSLQRTHRDLLLILAPRHPERFAEVADQLSEMEIPFLRRSELVGARFPKDPQVLLLDTLGELAGCYGMARVAFVGGSLVPVGGHNLLEPARFGVPIVVGPHIESVAELADRLEAAGGLRRAATAAELAVEIEHFLHVRDPEAATAARAMAAELSGALDDTWRALEVPLNGRPLV